MLMKRISSDLELNEIFRILEDKNALIISPGYVKSWEEVELAFHLAERSIRKGRNISRKFKYEFLLWLCGRRDIKTAMERSKPKNPDDMIFLSFDNELFLKKMGASENSFDLKKKAAPLNLEMISLSRL